MSSCPKRKISEDNKRKRSQPKWTPGRLRKTGILCIKDHLGRRRNLGVSQDPRRVRWWEKNAADGKDETT